MLETLEHYILEYVAYIHWDYNYVYHNAKEGLLKFTSSHLHYKGTNNDRRCSDHPSDVCPRPWNIPGSRLVDADTFSKLCMSRCFAALRQLRQIRHSFPAATLQTLVVALIHSRLDYGNSVLVGLPVYLMRRLQSVLNAAARLIFHRVIFLVALQWTYQ